VDHPGAISVNEHADVAVREVLGGLRAALDPDPERAGRKYVLLRRRLVSFFEWNGLSSPDARADEALTTAAWKMTDGAPVASVPACCVGVARTILSKHRALDTPPAASDATPGPPEREPFDDPDALRQAFEAAFDALPAEDRDLILARPLSHRAHRLRAQLEHDVLNPLERSSRETR
jgi:hypothetical protein